MQAAHPELVSVIIPYYQGEKWLPLSLASVLGQEGVTLEVIVVDDGSDRPVDDRLPALADLRVQVLRLPHGGKGAAVNAGVRMAGGDLVCVLDQDDEMLPGRLAVQAAALRGNPGVDAVYSDYERRDERGELIDVFKSRQAGREEMLHCLATSTGLFSMQTLLIRKQTFDAVGGLCTDDRITGFDDAEFFVRLLAAGCRFQHVPGVFARWNSHPSNYSKSARFQDARLFWIDRLTALATEHGVLRRELPFFKAHNYLMRGIFFLQTDRPGKATTEFVKAIQADRSQVNSYYLLAKSAVWSLLAPLRRRRRLP
ncbi:MAG TPA: glycosyltransferase [Candidatus Methylomirabilis sp.]|nr:glycosyltransferase [Candidatus Methylomirabilis sp.]